MNFLGLNYQYKLKHIEGNYMSIKILTIVLMLSLSLYGTDKDEYFISDLHNGARSLDSYYDALGIPNLYRDTVCRKQCENDCCYDVFKNRSGAIVKSFSTSDSVSTIARNRYKNKSFLLYNYTHGSGKDRVTDIILVDNHLNYYNISYLPLGGYDTAISKDGKIIEVTKNGIYIDGNHILDKMNFESAVISNDYKGNIAVAGIEKGLRSVYVSNLKKIKPANINLASRSDKNNILAVYPSDSTIYVVAYNLINIYNKGLLGAEVDFKNNVTKSGWIYNNEHKNIGFYPQIYLENKNLYVKTYNSGEDKNVHFLITQQELDRINKSAPDREGFEDESMVSFTIGAGVSYLGWSAHTSADDQDNKSYGEIKYDIANTLYKKVWLQGRVGDTQLAVSYMKNEAEKQGGLTKKASNLLSAMVDIDGLISDSGALRIAYESANINGIGSFIDKHIGAATNVTLSENSIEFESKLERFSLLEMQEKGFYTGLEYTKYQTPSAVGFSGSSKNMEYYGADEKFGITNIELVSGYDTASYAKRYETDFSKFYFQGLFGLGVSLYDMSSDFKKRVEEQSNKKIVNSNYSFVIDAQIEVGYVWQQRFKVLKGFGQAFDLGMKARGAYTGVGQSDNSDSSIESNQLSMEMSRTDVWYGPYLNYSIVF